MYLKEIRLENFKSFAGKTRIPLREGYTCITGPNGSGKSNISDAILFVLGPKSSKSIRAGNLTELIFNGGKSKRPARYCKVSLIFDNRDGVIPVDAKEVEFTRHVKLSKNSQLGYNSYFMVNGKSASLTKFDELLSHAGISSDGYNLVQQNDLSRFVEMGNVDRRRVLEDVAGISRFDEEIEKAGKQEEALEANLERIGIILDELKHQERSLKSQRETAMKSKKLRDELKKYRAMYSQKVVDELETEISGINQELSSHEEEEEKRLEARKELAEKIDDKSKKESEIEEEIASKMGDDSKKVKEEIDELKVKMAKAREFMDLNQDRRKEIKAEMRELEKEMKDSSKSSSQHTEILKELTEEKIKLDGQIEKKKAKVEELDAAISKSDSKASDIKKKIIGEKNELDEKTEELNQAEVEKEKARLKVESREEELASLQEDRKALEFELKDLKWQKSELGKEVRKKTKNVGQIKKRHEELLKKEKTLSQESADLESAINTLTRQYNNLKAEIEASEMVNSGYSRAVRSILEMRDKGKLKGVIGSVAELIKTSKDYETAIEIAAGGRLQAVVVESDEVASKAISYLKKNKLGRVTFLPMNKMVPGRPRGKAVIAKKKAEGFALDLIEYKEEHRGPLWYVFGDTLVVDSLSTARELMGGVRLVTLEGDLIESQGAMIGGKIARAKVKMGKGKEDQLEKAGKELRSAMEHSKRVTKELKETRKELAEVSADLTETSSQDSGKQVRLEALTKSLEESKNRLNKLKENIGTTEKILAKNEDHLKEITEKCSGLAGEVAQLKDRLSKLNQKLMEAGPAEVAKKLKKERNELAELEKTLARVEAQLESKKEALDLHSGNSNKAETRIEGLDAQRENLKRDNEKKKEELAGFKKDLDALLKISGSMDEKVEGLRKQRDQLYKEKTDLEARLEKLRVTSDAKNDYVIKLKTELKAKEDALNERRKELAGVEISPDEEIPSSSKLEKYIRIAEAKLDSQGPVNMHAIDEYERVCRRMEDLSEQVKTLKKESKKLKQVIEEAMEKKTTGLLEVMDAVNENFHNVYTRLSNGGEANVELEKPDAPFEGGLIMKARPPGKRVYRLEALSGGEKGLAALAFIFAIQKYKPSPFYLLDEADANLDALNAESAAKMVRTNSSYAQFLQISHRKVTLKEADDLVGITMQEKGASMAIMKVNISSIPTVEGQKGESTEVEA